MDRITPAMVRSTLRAIASAPGRLLTAGEESLLLAAVRAGCERDAAMDALIWRNIRMVRLAARQHAKPEYQHDAVAAGIIGLISAIEDFDPSRECRLSTFALHRIRRHVQRFVASHQENIRVPEHMVTKRNRMFRVAAEMRDELHRRPTDAELADATGYGQRTVAMARLTLRLPTVDLSPLVGVPAPAEFDPADAMADADLLRVALTRLDDRTRDMVARAFGLHGDAETYQAIADHYGLTRQRVDQIIAGAMVRLRAVFAEENEKGL